VVRLRSYTVVANESIAFTTTVLCNVSIAIIL